MAFHKDDQVTTRIVFMGTPEFALPTLQVLANHYAVVGVVTQPDRQSGRGRALAPPPVKALAQELGLEVMQPTRLREPSAMQKLRSWNPDLIIVAAFGQILKPDVLETPPYGCVNVHASLLPRWRGAAPIQAMLLAGDRIGGVTIMKMDSGIDTGPILSQRESPIESEDTAASLGEKLAFLGAEVLIQTLPDYLAGKISPQSQDDARATYAPMLKKEAGLLDFSQPAEALSRQVRAFYPWPGTFFLWKGAPIKVHQVFTVKMKADTPGKLITFQGYPAVLTGANLLVLQVVQPAGKKAMDGRIFLHGVRNWE
jgi:methionyl-tRNA formyltransferase